jgi:hypothetical protein
MDETSVPLPTPGEGFLLIVAIAMIIVIGNFVLSAAINSANDFVSMCDQKYGAENYTVEPGHDCGNGWLQLHDCLRCFPKW